MQPDHICQGKLADCYFLSAVSALAEVPGRIESLFNTKTVNKAGIYSLNLFVNGKVQEVIVDDLIPCDGTKKRPCFAHARDTSQVWLMLLEKAWAKLHGSYCMTRRGSFLSAMPHLTGAPLRLIDHNFAEDVDELWDSITHATQRGLIVVASSSDTDLATPTRTKQLLTSSYSYSVVSIVSQKM